MRRKAVIWGLIGLMLVTTAAFAGWHERNRRHRNRISHAISKMDDLHRLYDQGYIEFNGLTLVFSEEQKDSIKAHYNRLVDTVQVHADSLEYAP